MNFFIDIETEFNQNIATYINYQAVYTRCSHSNIGGFIHYITFGK